MAKWQKYGYSYFVEVPVYDINVLSIECSATSGFVVEVGRGFFYPARDGERKFPH